ncbi:SCJ1, partial [Symbiodinium sp. CCMP2456]
MAKLCKSIAPGRLRPAEIPALKVDPGKVTDIFFDFDGTLTASNKEGVSGYVLPLLERCAGLRISDCIEGPSRGRDILTWKELDLRMAAAVPEAILGETSVLGSLAVRQHLASSLKLLVASGIRLHLLTMGTPQTSKALLGAAGYDLNLFCSFLGPFDMAKNQSLRNLFDNGDTDGQEAAESFQFDVQEDIDALHHLQRTGD